jgi:replicative DNA helicase
MKPLPQNIEAEKALLGIVYNAPQLIGAVSENLFTHPSHKVIFKAVSALAMTGLNPNCGEFLPLSTELEKKGELEAAGGIHYVAEIAISNLGTPMLDYYVNALANIAVRRNVFTQACKIMEAIHEPDFDILSTIEEMQAASLIAGSGVQIKSMKSHVKDYLTELTDDTEPDYMRTGIPKLDHILRGGVAPGEVLTYCAPTGRGKSILLAMGAMEAIKQGKKALFFSTEMRGTEIVKRLVAQMTKQPIYTLREIKEWKNVVKKTQYTETMRNALTDLSKFPLTIVDDTQNRIEDFLSVADRLKSSSGCDLAVVDYIQRIEHKGNSREEQVAGVIRKMKTWAQRTNTPLMTASQLNDEGQVRESRTIGMESDHQINYADIEAGPKGVLVIKKNRRGPDGGVISVERMGATYRFVEIEERKDEDRK